MMQVMASSDATEVISHYESCVLAAYKDAGGKWAIGYGHTSGVKEGDTCTQEQAQSFLLSDLADTELVLRNSFTKIKLLQQQFDALCSLVYNIGGTQWGNSQLKHAITMGKSNAPDYFLQFITADFGKGPQAAAGLIKRRMTEIVLYTENRIWFVKND